MTANELPDYALQIARDHRIAKAKAAGRTVTADAVQWIEDNFYIPETPDHRFTLAPYQKRALREALRKDDSGNYVYNTVVWSDIKKGLKSTIAAAVGLYDAYARDWSTVYVIANDLKQADSRVAYYMRRAIELNPRMKAECKINRYLIELPNHSRIEAIPIDPSGEAGSNADRLIFSELWGWKHDSAQRMWTEMTIPPQKFGRSQRWAEGYAGFIGESPILEMLFDTAVTNGQRIDNDLELYRSGSILALWNTQPRLPWQTPEYYASEASILPPSEFARVHRNQWSESSEIFVPSEWWEACKGELPTFSPFTPMVISIDAAVSGDSFGMVGVSRINDKTVVRYVNEWKPPHGGTINFDEPRAELERLVREYNIECCCYDPHEMHYLASLMTQEGTVFMRPFSQAGDRLEADANLYNTIRERNLIHNGDTRLTQHVLNANRKIDAENRKLRIVKRREQDKIDLCVALSMAHHVANELQL